MPYNLNNPVYAEELRKLSPNDILPDLMCHFLRFRFTLGKSLNWKWAGFSALGPCTTRLQHKFENWRARFYHSVSLGFGYRLGQAVEAFVQSGATEVCLKDRKVVLNKCASPTPRESYRFRITELDKHNATFSRICVELLNKQNSDEASCSQTW